MSKNQPVVVDSEDDSDCYEIAETNCEFTTVEGHLCSIPYDLYNLPDLTEILSVNTWNSILTEDERFFLSRFIPDMDQETFDLTINELLGGADFYFGNPVDKLYNRLRGGSCTPKVACYKEALMLFKRKKYYYSLKLYHERMIKTFEEMQRLWNQYGDELGNKVRILLWSGRTQSKDLTSVPYRNRTKKRLTSSVHRNHQTFSKGVLKVLPKSSSVILGEPYVASQNNLMHINGTGSMSTTFAGSTFGNPYGTIVTEQPKCLVNQQDTCFTYLETKPISIIQGTKKMLYDPTETVYGGIDASDHYSMTAHSLITKKEEYVNNYFHFNSSAFKPAVLDTSSDTKSVLSGIPLHVQSKDSHALETDDDDLYSLMYKGRKAQRMDSSTYVINSYKLEDS